jgi:serine/threonine protein phosphatase 1
MSRASEQTSAQPFQYPPAPEGYTIYAIGDIHGRLDLLDRLHRAIDKDKADNRLSRSAEIYLGDYIDRGPESAAVVTRLIARARQTQTIFLRGNHEQFLLDFLAGADCLEAWRALGGIACLLSYGVKVRHLTGRLSAPAVRQALTERLPPDHLRFYADTGRYCFTAPYLFVHAGIRPGKKLEDQAIPDLLGIRQPFLEFEGDFGFIVVHGHTPVNTPDLRHNRINIDTGAYATNRLTCLRIAGDGARILTS